MNYRLENSGRTLVARTKCDDCGQPITVESSVDNPFALFGPVVLCQRCDADYASQPDNKHHAAWRAAMERLLDQNRAKR